MNWLRVVGFRVGMRLGKQKWRPNGRHAWGGKRWVMTAWDEWDGFVVRGLGLKSGLRETDAFADGFEKFEGRVLDGGFLGVDDQIRGLGSFE